MYVYLGNHIYRYDSKKNVTVVFGNSKSFFSYQDLMELFIETFSVRKNYIFRLLRKFKICFSSLRLVRLKPAEETKTISKTGNMSNEIPN